MKKTYILLAVLLLLGACGLTKKDLGMTRSKPDESQVSAREKLVVPPDFGVRPSIEENSGI